MEIIKLKITEIKPYDKNPRKNDGAVDAVAESIKQCGYCAPIVIDEDNVILAGHTRLKALKKLKYKECECVRKVGMTEEQKRKYRLLDNKTNELAEWDMDLLKGELDGLDFLDFDFGFDIADESEPQAIVEDVAPEVDEENEPITKLGDIWQLGRHRLMCGDSTDKKTIDLLMDGAAADMLLTDPPYNVNYEGGTAAALKIANDNMPEQQFFEFLKAAFEAADGAMHEGAAFYIWHADSEGLNFRKACAAADWKVRQCLIWVKNSFVMGRQDYQWKHEPCLYGWKDGAAHYFIDDRTQSTVFEDKIDIDKLKKEELKDMLKIFLDNNMPTTVIHEDKPLKNAEHPTMKPVNLFARLIKNSTMRDDIVLDIFGGSGTTLIACEQLYRVCHICELDPRYCDVIVKRWENFTGNKAKRINGDRNND